MLHRDAIMPGNVDGFEALLRLQEFVSGTLARNMFKRSTLLFGGRGRYSDRELQRLAGWK
jgi:hypothetical protein